MTKIWKACGVGVGLRSQHYPIITSQWPKMDWFEAITENYMDTGGRPLHILEEVRQHYPVALHGTALSIGSVDPLNPVYLERLKALVDRIDPFIVSDHLCWSGVHGETLHDLLPLPFTEEAIEHVVKRIDQVQNLLKRRILIENVSSYLTYKHSTLTEWEFLSEIARRADCGILLDLNNIFVNSVNHQFEPLEYLEAISSERIGQIHLAGHTNMGKFLFDTHGGHVIESVWNLYREGLKRWGKITTLIEWDSDIPEFERLSQEADKARVIYNAASAEAAERRDFKVISISDSKPSDVPSLIETELWFRDHMVPREKIYRGNSSVLLNQQGGEPGEKRFSVYADGYVARIHESLREVFEAVSAICGHELFIELAEAYAARYYSAHYNLNNAGEHFAEFLQAHPVIQKYPYLPDLARLEWKISEAFHAFDGEPLLPQKLSAIPMDEWDHAQLVFQPSVSIFSSSWPVLDLWELRKQTLGESHKKVEQKKQRILIGRKGLQVRCQLLNSMQYDFVQTLLAGKTLGQALEAILSDDAETLPPLQEWFAAWMHDGLLADCRLLHPSKS